MAATRTTTKTTDAKIWQRFGPADAEMFHAFPDGFGAICNSDITTAGDEPQTFADADSAKFAEGLCPLCYSATRNTNKRSGGSKMAAKNDTPEMVERAARIEQIEANIERVQSLVEAENGEGAAELTAETQALIADIKGTGSLKIRKGLTDELTAAGQAIPAETPKSTEVAAPVAGVVALETADFKSVEGVSALIEQGAQVAREGIAVQRKAADTARNVAEVIFEMRLKMRNKLGVPDLKATNQQTKLAARAVYESATASMEGTDENRETVEQLMTAVQYQMSDVTVKYVRALDDNPELYAELFPLVKEANPELDPSAAVFAYYKLNPKSKSELAAEKARQKALSAQERQAITSGSSEAGEGEGDGEPNEAADTEITPDEYAKGIVLKLAKALKGVPDGLDKFAAASDETKEEVKSDLEDMLKVVKRLIAETV